MNPTAHTIGKEFDFCQVLSEMLQAGTTVGRGGQAFGEIGAVSTLNNLHVLRQLQLDLKPSRTLEVGLCFGGSCPLFTATHHELTGRAARQHTALDPFQTEIWDDAG